MVAFAAILAARVQKPLQDELGEENPNKLSPEQWQKVRAAQFSQKLLGLDYYSGGHLTHGYRFNLSGLMFDAHSYRVDARTKLIDLDQLRAQLRELRPLILLAGYSAYSRKLNFANDFPFRLIEQATVSSPAPR